jgi:hypothetical protein
VLAVLAMTAVTSCSTRPDGTGAPVLPPAQPSAAATATGPGAYVGEALNAVGTPVPVRVVVAADTTAAPDGDASAVARYLRRARASLGLPDAEVRFVTVEVDNTGEIDAVPLPDNIDVLNAEGRGANFRPAYGVVQEFREQLQNDEATSEAGQALLQRLLVREGQVRPGQVVTVPYVSNDALSDVAQVIVNGSLARKDAA